MKKILFIVPPKINSSSKVPERLFGCCYLVYPMPNIFSLTCAAVLEKEGYSVRYLDCITEHKGIRDVFGYLNKEKLDFICIYSVNLAMEQDIAFIKRIRGAYQECKIIFMGPAPTYFTDRFLIDENTFVVRGEPEDTLKELTNALSEGSCLSQVAGVSYLENRIPKNNPSRINLTDLDPLPFPARHLVNRNKYYNPKLGIKPFTAVLTSRGCSHKCIYCVPNSLSFARELEFKKANGRKPPVAIRSAENVIEEFILLKSAGYRAVSILDDQFIWEKERIFKICAGIKGLGVKWGCLSRADHLSDSLVKAMAESGCRYIDIGIESFDRAILDYIKKRQTPESVREGVALLKKYKISAKVNIIFGASPFETKNTIAKTISELKKINPDMVMFSACNPFPGTEFYQYAKENNWLLNNSYRPVDVQKEAIISYPHLKSRELEKTIRQANRQFFLRPNFLLKNMFRQVSLSGIICSMLALRRKMSRG